MAVLAKLIGRLGNNMFQLWSSYGIAKANKPHEWWVPTIDILEAFTGPFRPGSLPDEMEIKESGFTYAPINVQDKQDVRLSGYFQSEKYWLPYEDKLRKLFTFKDSFIAQVHNKFPFAVGSNGREMICISVRRGDFVNNPAYYQLPAMYYIGALITHFPDFLEKDILILSDDYGYCRAHFDCLPNVFYADQLSPIEQLCAGHMADYHIISNSTFSWWCAYLAKSKKVIRPKYNFGEAYRADHPETDFWPETKKWEVFDYEGFKIPLQDFTFMIPVYHDHNDRKQNLDLTVCMLQRDFETNVMVMEQGGRKFEYQSQWCDYSSVNYPVFHRTKMLNEMAKAATTEYLFNWDADVVVPPLQIYLTAETLRKGLYDFVYPYDGRFVRVLRRPYFKILSKALDIGVYQNASSFEFNSARSKEMATSSVGGAIGMERTAFLESGGENEHMVSYAPEDCERWDRWHALGYKVVRIPGKLYHLDHFCGPDSCSRNPYFSKNHEELDRIRAMTAPELRAYVQSWPWLTK